MPGVINLVNRDLNLTVDNVSSRTVSVAGLQLAPGESKTVELRYINDNYRRAMELSDLVNANLIQVTFNNPAFNYRNLGPLTPEYLGSLSAYSAQPLNYQVGLAVNRPAVANVPVGFQYFAYDTPLLNISDGTGWVQADGTPIP